MKISTILKQHRLDLNLTQEQVAEKIFVSTKSISNWENDKNFPDIESLVRLAKLYNLSLDSLLLEGSDIMNDIKKKEKAYELQKISLLGPQLTNFILFLMLLLPDKFKTFYISDSMNCLILLAIFSNSVTVFYFINQLKKYDIKEDENKKYMIMKNLFRNLFGILICIVGICIYLYKK
ncbi:helix-turn-helix transcriptional regulator [Clostridium perfringens]|nr:helix-turn-helix transcriptional regulator [Clostridium perfringens]